MIEFARLQLSNIKSSYLYNYQVSLLEIILCILIDVLK